MNSIRFYVQDVEHVVPASELSAETTLNTYLRKKLNLTGTKKMCLEGGCGSCIVVVENKAESAPIAVNSCLVSLLSCDGWRIRTIEGIGDPSSGFHPIQKTLVQFNGTQCGFCTSGMIMNMYALHKSGEMTMKQIENSFGGNICRCTGYRSILSAFKSLCSDADPELLGRHPTDIEDLKLCQMAPSCTDRCNSVCDKRIPFYHNVRNNSKWIKVFTLKELFDLSENLRPSKYTFVAGNTGRGVFKPKTSFESYIDIADIKELQKTELTSNELILGANTTLTKTMEILYETSQKPRFSYLKKVADHVDLIANVPVRNIGTLAGNLMMKYHNHEFPSDIFLLLETCHAKLRIIGFNGINDYYSPQEFLKIDMNFKIIVSITFPPHSDDVIFETYKIMPRAQNAHAIINAGFLFAFDKSNTLKSATIVYGNINPNFVHAIETEQFLIGRNLFDNSNLQKCYRVLARELNPVENPPEPSPEFRRELAIALFYKTILSHARSNDQLCARNTSGGLKLVRPISRSTQDYVTSENLYPLTQAVVKIEALAQSSGGAEYIEDMPDLPGQLYGSLVLAQAPPNSVIRKIDAAKALQLHPSIRAFYTKDDIPGDNNYMPGEIYPHKEEIFCNGTVVFYHQPLGLIVGTDFEEVQRAADLVEVIYDPPRESAPMISIRQVLKSPKAHHKISLDKTISGVADGSGRVPVANPSVKGAFDVYHQYHFHMETQCCNVIPREDGLDIYPSSQWLDPLQIAVANMLGLPNSKINVKVRRCGGAFGAKISRNTLVACAASLAAWKLKQPVKLSLPLTTNMEVIGKRFPLSTDYEVRFDNIGIVEDLSCKHYTDSGMGSNEIVMGYLLNLFTGTYKSDAFSMEMYTVKTDTHANTWTRAPGSTEGLASIESIMDHIAYSIDADPLEVRIANIASPVLLKYIADLKEWADIDRRKTDIKTFNKENRWKKRGISVVPMIYHFDIPAFYSASVSIHHGDGSVSISHGGVEIGQGINTKVAQVCAFKFGIPLEAISIMSTQTSVSPNCMYTGGSLTSEAVCFGTLKACEELLGRMEPHRDATKPESWRELVEKCHRNFVNLSAMGEYSPKTPKLGSYKVYGVCAAEVMVDVLTGQHLVSRVDLLEDTGTTLTPNIDIGQVEGAFIMGLGYYTSEKIVFSPEGKILTNNTWTYKPPGARDIPIDFRVKFPKNDGNPVGVLNSKATAEPPFTLSVSVPLAIRNAVASARSDSDSTQPKWFPFNGPTTVEDTFMNCLNKWEDYVL